MHDADGVFQSLGAVLAAAQGRIRFVEMHMRVDKGGRSHHLFGVDHGRIRIGGSVDLRLDLEILALVAHENIFNAIVSEDPCILYQQHVVPSRLV